MNLHIHTSPKRIIIGSALGFTYALCLVLIYNFFTPSAVQTWVCALMGAVGVFSIVLKPVLAKKNPYVRNMLLLMLLAVLSAITFDLWNNLYIRLAESGLEMQVFRVILSIAFCCIFFGFLYSLTGSFKASGITGCVLTAILGFISYLILMFRGTYLLFADILGLGTALEVMNNYSMSYSSGFYLGLMGTAAMAMVCSAFVPIVKTKRKQRLIRLFTFLGALYAAFGIWSLPLNRYYYSWLESDNSYVFAVVVNAKMMNIKPSKNYSDEEITNIIKSAQGKESFLPADYNATEAIRTAFPDYVAQTGSTKPNIIAVMNESFTDLRTYNDNISTDQPMMPYIDSLDNAIKGYVYTEVFGGGTADSEYTFLTGNSTFTVPTNIRPYQMYIDETTPSLTSVLNDDGYDSYAIHPGAANAWNRNVVYPELGFKDFYDASTFNGTMTRRVPFMYSDLSTYQKVINLYEHKGSNPLFVFDVTIQNHGGYNLPYDNLQNIELTGLDGHYPNADQFVSLVRASDEDYSALIEYFKQATEPTIIVMFGDHQPTLDPEFYNEALGTDQSALSVRQSQTMQRTPYVIWANYPLPMSLNKHNMSLNYLSTLTMECAGLERTPYMEYLTYLYKTLPVVDKKGIITIKGEAYFMDDENMPEEYKNLLKQYRDVLYNNIFDSKGRVSDLYSTAK